MGAADVGGCLQPGLQQDDSGLLGDAGGYGCGSGCCIGYQLLNPEEKPLMNKEYRYASRKLVLHLIFTPVFLGGGLFLTLLVVHMLMAPRPNEDKTPMPVLAVMGLLSLCVGLRDIYNAYIWAGTSLLVTEEGLVCKTHNGAVSYPLEDVYLRNASEHYGGKGRVIVIGPDNPHLFHRSGKIIWWQVVELQESGMFLTELKERFDAKELFSHYDPDKLSRWCAKAAKHERVK